MYSSGSRTGLHRDHPRAGRSRPAGLGQLDERNRPANRRYPGTGAGGGAGGDGRYGDNFSHRYPLSARLPVGMIRYRPKAGKEEAGNGSRSYLSEIREGLKHTFSVSWLWITMIVAALINAATTGSFNVALPFLVKETLGGGAGILGTVMTFLGVGALLGGLFMGS